MFCDLKPEKAVISYTEWLEKASQCGCPEGRRCDPSRIDGSARNSSIPARCESLFQCNYDQDWVEPDVVQYREIKDWPHLNNCVKTLEVLNIGVRRRTKKPVHLHERMSPDPDSEYAAAKA